MLAARGAPANVASRSKADKLACFEAVLLRRELLTCVGLFVANKPRMDVVALLVIVVLPLCGITSVPEALAGFSDPIVVLIATLFVIGEGLVRTGITYQLGDLLVTRLAGAKRSPDSADAGGRWSRLRHCSHSSKPGSG